MNSCLFCKIVNREIESEVVHEDDHCVAFKDIDPQAPVHILIVPKQHVADLNAASDDVGLVGRLCAAAAQVAREQGIAESGYRLVMNCGPHGQQSVDHLHVHVLGGRQMTWPPG